MDTGAVLGGTGLFISLVGIIYSAINHKHIRATCCGKQMDFSIDIDSTDNSKKGEGKSEEKEEPKEEEKPKNTIIRSHIPRIVPHFDI
jgi:hypothetical protein